MVRKILADLGAHPWTAIYTAVVVTVLVVVEVIYHW